MEDGNCALKLNDDVFYRANVASLIRSSKSSQAEVLGIKVQLRDTTDCPDITQSHYAMGKFFEGVLVPDRGEIIDSPNTTSSHIALAKSLSPEYLESQPNVVDLGCGAGFLGTFLGKRASLERLIFSDLSRNSLNLAKRTFDLNKGNNFKTLASRAYFVEGDAAQTLSSLDGGVAVCAPYLIPQICTVFPGVYHLFAGIAKNQGMDLYIGHSSLSDVLVRDACESSGLKPKEVYKIENVELHPEYSCERFRIQKEQVRAGRIFPETIELLREFGLKEKNDKYFHDIKVTRLSGR